jgi:glutamate-1-semialdehyde 2,1-aminomutase
MNDTAVPRYSFDETARRMAEGSQWLAGGASSDYRLGSSALVIDRASGALLFDVDGNRLIDYYCGAGPIILGHDAPVVVDAVIRQVRRGVQLGGETAEEYEAARLVTEIVPCAKLVRFANTGSEGSRCGSPAAPPAATSS